MDSDKERRARRDRKRQEALRKEDPQHREKRVKQARLKGLNKRSDQTQELESKRDAIFSKLESIGSVDDRIHYLEKEINTILSNKENNPFCNSIAEHCFRYYYTDLITIPFEYRNLQSDDPLRQEYIKAWEKVYDRIDRAGGFFRYYKTNRVKLNNRIPLDTLPHIYFINCLIDKFEKLEREKREADRIQSILENKLILSSRNSNKTQGNYTDDNIMRIITWDKSKKEFLRHKALLQKSEISFTSLSVKGKPYFKRGDEAKAAASLFLYWYNNNYITGLMKDSKKRKSYNTDIITNAFSMNSNKEFNERALRDALQRVDKNDKSKLDVFADLLKNK